MSTTAIQTSVAAASERQPLPASSQTRWSLSTTCPPEWADHIRWLRGGFFHSPIALALAVPAGTPIFARLMRGDAVVGIAAGARTRCRFSARQRHAHFPTLPAIHDGVPRDVSLASLIHELSGAGIEDVTFDSFDATYRPDAAFLRGIAGAMPAPERQEYVVSLIGTDDDLARQFSTHHTRHVHRGEREAWHLEWSPPNEAATALASVAENAAARAAARGDPFTPGHWVFPAGSANDAHWGVAVLRAYSDTTLLGAALIGWGGARAFYIAGGSTSEGYARGASTWLHWSAMRAMRARGMSLYNFGGAPADASNSAHPAHGLHRFKTGFGPDIVPLRGMAWSTGSFHAVIHRVARRISGVRNLGRGAT